MSNYAEVEKGKRLFKLGGKAELKRVETACKDVPHTTLSPQCFTGVFPSLFPLCN